MFIDNTSPVISDFDIMVGCITTKTIERDTTSPNSPTTSTTKYGNRVSGERMNLNVNGEGNTKAEIKVSFNGIDKTLNQTLNSNGQYSTNDLIGRLQCGKITYSVQVRLSDRAGNTGGWSSPAEVITQDCLVCATSSGSPTNYSPQSFTMPVNNAKITEEFGTYKNSQEKHYGMDFGASAGSPVIASASGVVVESLFGNTANVFGTANEYAAWINYGAGNLVTIKHNSGLYTTYFHMQNKQVINAGDNVTQGQVIGYVGNIGNSEGAHLHFQVEDSARGGFAFGAMRKATAINPRLVLGQIVGNINFQAPEEVQFCKDQDQKGAALSKTTEDWLYDNSAQGAITANFKLDWFGNPQLDTLENATPQIKRIVKETDFHLGDNIDINSVSNQYNLYAIAPSRNTNILIRVKDSNGNTLSEKTEVLQEARTNWRKSTAGQYNIIPEDDNDSTTGRISVQVQASWNSDTTGNGNKVAMNSNIYIDSYIKHISNNCYNGKTCELKSATGRYKTNSDNKTLDSNTEKLIEASSGIEKRIDVTGENSDINGNVLAKDPNYRGVKLTSVNAKQIDKYTTGNVWILSHGWNGGLDVMSPLAKTIADQNPDDVVLWLDWREVSHNNSNMGATGNCSVGTWTESLSYKIRDRLNDWGFSNGSKLKLVGHSMGTILNSEIGLRFGKASYSMSLDNPNAGNCGGSYNVNSSNQKVTSFYRTSTNSFALTGTYSPAGNMSQAETASIPIAFNYDNRNSLDGDWHGFNQQTWAAMQTGEALQADILNNRDQDISAKSNWSTFAQKGLLKDGDSSNYSVQGVLNMNTNDKNSRGNVGNLEYRISGNISRVIQRK